MEQIGFVLFSAALVFVATWFWRYRSRVEKERDEAAEWRSEMELKIAVLGTQMMPLWSAVQSQIAKDLTHPHPQFRVMDSLLRKLESLTITHDERRQLSVLLDERIVSTDPAVSDAERESAKLMKGVMAKVLVEAEQAKDPQGTEIILGLVGLFVTLIYLLVGK